MIITKQKRSRTSVLFFVKRNRINKEGTVPVMLRITVDKRVEEISIKKRVLLKNWNTNKGCSIGKDMQDRILNAYLNEVKLQISDIEYQLLKEQIPLSAALIKKKLLKKDGRDKTLIEVYTEHNNNCKELIGKDYTKSTVEKFDTSLKHLKEFIKTVYKREDLSLRELNNEFIQDFDFFLKTEKNLQNNSANKHHKNLKKIIHLSLNNGWIDRNPFAGFRLKNEKTKVVFLLKEEIDKILHKEFKTARLRKVADVFVFCCYTGLAFIDSKRLTPDDLMTDNEGQLWIVKDRRKTDKTCNIPVIDAAKKIIEKYKKDKECLESGVCLPVLSNQKMNEYLKEIADVCGINKNLSTHVARHTCATTILLGNRVTLKNAADILGHSSTRMTERYAHLLPSVIKEDMALVNKRIGG